MYNKQSKTKEPENTEHGYNYALFLLNLRLRTEQEIRYKMQGRGYNSAVIEEVLQRLKSNSYIDDEKFVEALVESFKRYKNFGYYIIQKKLMEKHVPRKLVDILLPNLLTVSGEVDIAKRYLAKEGLTVSETSFQARQKIATKLNSRGFRGEVITKIFSGVVPE